MRHRHYQRRAAHADDQPETSRLLAEAAHELEATRRQMAKANRQLERQATDLGLIEPKPRD